MQKCCQVQRSQEEMNSYCNFTTHPVWQTDGLTAPFRWFLIPVTLWYVFSKATIRPLWLVRQLQLSLHICIRADSPICQSGFSSHPLLHLLKNLEDTLVNCWKLYNSLRRNSFQKQLYVFSSSASLPRNTKLNFCCRGWKISSSLTVSSQWASLGLTTLKHPKLHQ